MTRCGKEEGLITPALFSQPLPGHREKREKGKTLESALTQPRTNAEPMHKCTATC